jgi:PAS domain S-box-containing protein
LNQNTVKLNSNPTRFALWRTSRIRALCWSISVLGIASAVCAQPAPKPNDGILLVGIEERAEPFSSSDSSHVSRGFSVDLLNAIASDQHLRLQFVAEPLSALLDDARAHKIDILGNIAYTPERAEFLDFSAPFMNSPMAIFVHKGGHAFKSSAELATARIAVSREGVAHGYLVSHHFDQHLTLADSLGASLVLLDEGKVDVVIGSKLVAQRVQIDRTLNNIEESNVQVPDLRLEFHFAVPKARNDLLYALNLGLFHVRESGRFAQISSYWFGPGEAKTIQWRDLVPYWLPLSLVSVILGVAVWRQRKLMRRLRRQTNALRTSEERLRLALAGSREAIWDWDVSTQRVVRSERWAEILGYRPEEIPANIDAFSAWLHPDDVERFDAFRRRMLDGQGKVEYRLRASDSTWRWIFDRGAVVARAPDGSPLRVTGVATDITSRKQTEEALARSQALLEQSQEIAEIGGWEYDLISGQLYWTRQTYRIHDMDTPPARLSLDYAIQFFTPAGQAALRSAIDKAVRDGSSFELDLEIVTAKSRLVWVRTTGRAESKEGRVVRLHGSYQDISKQKKADEDRQKLQLKMLEAQKLESLGVLAGGIAHDFNNLLTVILGNTSLAREDSGAVNEALNQIEVASQRAAALCRQMLAYAGKGRFTIEVVDLNAVVEDTVQLLKLSISKNATIHFSFAPETLAIEADASQVRQVIMNLVINASEALGGATGRITIQTTSGTWTKEQLRDGRLGQDLAPGDYVGLEVEDNGSGMSAETMSRIFDPFFTTKFTGRGLGLAAVVGVVRAHKGALFVKSTLGRGTSFRILFPRSQAKLNKPAATPSTRSGFGEKNQGTILVVDDEPHVRSVAGALLQRHGYNVAMAADGYEALALALAHGARFTAVLLDLTMPGLDGPGTLKELRVLNPTLPVLLMSGFSESDVRKRMPGDPFVSFLPKPFTAEDLIQKLRELLRRAQPKSAEV